MRVHQNLRPHAVSCGTRQCSPLRFDAREPSRTSMSLLNLFKILPSGVVSIHRAFARTTDQSIQSNSDLDARSWPKKLKLGSKIGLCC